jgi:protocatechuate 3,4-dioxygenase, alpha subunit
MMRTPSQTVGPYYAIGLCRRPENELARPDDAGATRLVGRLLDGEGAPVGDGLIELWDAAGQRWGRSGTDADGSFSFAVTKPAGDAPHFDVYVFARGLLRHQLTRVYFSDEPDDAVLESLDAADRATLVADVVGGVLRFDIRLQGDRQTVFFAH